MNYIHRFSSTEKAIFGLFVIAAFVTAIIMATKVNDRFKTEVPAHGGELHEGIVGLPRTINPVLAITDVDYDLSKLVYSGLMKYDDGSIVPDIAQSYTISKDGLTYDFKLRDDVKFQDGTRLTADDVIFTIQKIQNSTLKSPRRSDWVNVTVNEISPNEIQFILKQPYSPFLSNTTTGIIPKHIWGSVGDDQFIFSQYNTEPIGTGPYKISSISRDGGGIPTEYRLQTWSSYYGREPYIKTLSFDFFSDEEKALSALDAGSIDSLSAVPSQAAVKLASDSAQAYTVLSSPLPRIFGLFMNQAQVAVLADKTVRQALDMSIDRDAIIEKVLNGYGTSITGPLPPGLQESDATSTKSEGSPIINSINLSKTPQTIPPGIIAAQALLEGNGWRINDQGVYMKKSAKGNASTTLSFDIYTADSPDLKMAAEIIKNTWKALGANVNVKVFESSELYQNIIRPRKFDILLFGEQTGKDRDLYAFWHSSQRNAPGLNVTMYTNSKVDKVLEDIRTTNDENVKDADYTNLEKLIRADIPAIFLYSPDFTYVVPKKVKGISLQSITVPSDRWNSIGDWYINTEKVWKIFTQ
jgi:peptide/nickel transport system substrate-binding protein